MSPRFTRMPRTHVYLDPETMTATITDVDGHEEVLTFEQWDARVSGRETAKAVTRDSRAPEHWSEGERAAYDCGFDDGRGAGRE